jgi:hypothetical protein
MLSFSKTTVTREIDTQLLPSVHVHHDDCQCVKDIIDIHMKTRNRIYGPEKCKDRSSCQSQRLSV